MPGKRVKAIKPVNRRATFSYKSLKVGDAKGRVLLGPDVAGRPVQVEEHSEGEWMVRLVEPIPIKEAWLFKNKEALNLVTTGVMQARNHEFAEDPMAGRDYSWLDDVDEENV